MSLAKRVVCLACSVCLLAFCCAILSGCGKQVAATWAHGDIDEETVTTTIENMRTSYGMTDDTSWASFVAGKSYDSSTSESEEAATDGTAADLRNYVINQMIREDIIDYEIEQSGLEVSEDEIDAYVEQQKSYIESMYMPGVFESVIQQQGYKDLEAYRESVKQILLEQKLMEQAVGDASDTDAWNTYLDGLVAYADVQINDMPSGLSYDVDTSATGTSDSTEESGDNAAQGNAAAEGESSDTSDN